MREVLLLCWRDTGHPQGGGSERYLEQVGAGLARRGVRVTLRTASYPGAPAEEIVDGIRISRGGGRLSVYPRALAAIAAGRLGFGPLKGIAPDAVIDTQNGIPFFSRAALGVPVTLLVHHCHREQWPVAGPMMAKLGWWLESTVSPRVHRRNQYLTVSLPSADELVALGVARERIAVVRNGADEIPQSVPEGDDTTRTPYPSLTVLSRLVPHKQIEDALDVVAALCGRIPDIHLDVIGGGWWEQNLRDYVGELGIEDYVTFHGHVEEERKHELLGRSWVHVMPSRKEGWGLAVVEAAQHGVPTVGYRSSKGLTDSIIDGVTGVLVGGLSVGDEDRHVSGLIAAVSELLLDAEARTRLGEKARVRAGEFSWEQCAQGVYSVLEATTRGTWSSGLVGSGDAAPQTDSAGASQSHH
ncbi:Glycosyl transferase [Rhodococcus sp. AW25M09]|uniref:glycosyltransferase family 4 protein n=1 Tax=Rhodococcus sp. AW25M09 TaxID=1268303 RepID=UPI0002ABF8F0|nr:glycosyltransferase family 4 protein [Rhodococcus sp. AW25M09]CCQ13768.1 Glycosyl transferase [Rhodococcus sp. AW25M09]